MRAAKAQTSLITSAHKHIEEMHAVAVNLIEMMGTSRNSFCLPHVCRCIYPDFVTCEDQSAHRTVLSAPLFLEQNIKHFVGPDLGPTVC